MILLKMSRENLEKDLLLDELSQSESNSSNEDESTELESSSSADNKYYFMCRKKRRLHIFTTSESEIEEIEEIEEKYNALTEITWMTKDFNPKIYKLSSDHSGIKANNINESSKIIDYFQLFISEELVNFIVDKTNNYWINSNKNTSHNRQDTIINELYCFIAISLLMSRNKKLSLVEYWSEDKYLRSDIFSEIMSRDRYLMILRMIYFSDDIKTTDDRLNKIQPIIDMLHKSFSDSFQPYKRLCIDESLLLYKGKLSFKQYIPAKRNIFGIKSFILCDCKTGYIQDIIVYPGSDTIMDIAHKDIGKSGNIVLSLLKPYLGQGHTLYVDNWYSSPALFNLLHKNKTNACGTVEKRREGMPRIVDKLKKGEASFRSSENILVMKWLDKKEVYMISTMHAATFGEVFKRKGKEIIKKPLCVIDYNNSTVIVDKTDMVISSVDSTHKTLKWYCKFFFHMIDICVWNAYCLYKHKMKKTISMSKFHLQLIKEIVEKYHEKSIHRNTRIGNNCSLTAKHLPSSYTGKNKRRRCVVCSKNDKRRTSRYQCEDCNVGLCISPCFKIYHINLHY